MASRGVNKVILVGNLGQDPEVRYMPNGGAVANITLATSESWRDKATGEMKEQTEWHRVVLFGKLAEVASEYLRKGSQVLYRRPAAYPQMDRSIRSGSLYHRSRGERWRHHADVGWSSGVVALLQVAISVVVSHQGGWGQPQQPQDGNQFSGGAQSRPQQSRSGSAV